MEPDKKSGEHVFPFLQKKSVASSSPRGSRDEPLAKQPLRPAVPKVQMICSFCALKYISAPLILWDKQPKHFLSRLMFPMRQSLFRWVKLRQTVPSPDSTWTSLPTIEKKHRAIRYSLLVCCYLSTTYQTRFSCRRRPSLQHISRVTWRSSSRCRWITGATTSNTTRTSINCRTETERRRYKWLVSGEGKCNCCKDSWKICALDVFFFFFDMNISGVGRAAVHAGANAMHVIRQAEAAR